MAPEWLVIVSEAGGSANVTGQITGQILGDRQTGKTAIALDTILNQRGQNVLCVYCEIGQHPSAVAKAMATLRENGAMEYTLLVVTEGDAAPGPAFIAP